MGDKQTTNNKTETPTLLLNRTQTVTFPTDSPRSFELPETGVLEVTFAATRPVAPPAWKEKHVRAALQKAREATGGRNCRPHFGNNCVSRDGRQRGIGTHDQLGPPATQQETPAVPTGFISTRF